MHDTTKQYERKMPRFKTTVGQLAVMRMSRRWRAKGAAVVIGLIIALLVGAGVGLGLTISTRSVQAQPLAADSPQTVASDEHGSTTEDMMVQCAEYMDEMGGMMPMMIGMMMGHGMGSDSMEDVSEHCREYRPEMPDAMASMEEMEALCMEHMHEMDAMMSMMKHHDMGSDSRDMMRPGR